MVNEHNLALKLDREQMRSLLGHLGQRLAQQGRLVEIALYGGSALALQFTWRDGSYDIDYQPMSMGNHALKQAAVAMASEHGLSPDWINDAVGLNPLPEKHRQTFAVLGDFPPNNPGLRVVTATPDYLLAMKIAAMRSSAVSQDGRDIWHLWEELGLETADDAVSVFKKFFPSREIPQRTRLILEDMQATKEQDTPWNNNLAW